MEANERKQNREPEAQKRKVLIEAEENKVTKGVEEKQDSLESDEKNRARRVPG